MQNSKLSRKEKLQKIGKYYEQGYTSKEIANILQVTDCSIRQTICRNFSHLKEIHNNNKKLNHESRMLIEKRCKKFISDTALLKQNRQSYNYDKDYNLVFNEKRGEIPNGLPSKYMRTN
ncbi:MAG: helix-turn-helix transcriptional regulator [Paraclostridium sp.]|uniref:helix-turn-helix transcriptional regulator n=1 Tax=Paraclostridium sp. TaxID=2023273 RepID=UPI003EE50D12